MSNTFAENIAEINSNLRRVKPMPIKARRTTILRVVNETRKLVVDALGQVGASPQLRAYSKPLKAVANTLSNIGLSLTAKDDEFTQQMYDKALDMALARLADMNTAHTPKASTETHQVVGEVLASRLDDIRKTVQLPTHTNKAFVMLKAPVVPILQNREFSYDAEFAALRMKTQRVEQYNVIFDQYVLGFERARASEYMGTEIKLPRVSKKLLKQIEDAGFGKYEPTYEGLMSFLEATRKTVRNKRAAETAKPMIEEAEAMAKKIKAAKDDADLDDTYIEYAHEVLKSINEGSGAGLALVVEKFVRAKTGNLIFFWVAPSRAVTKMLAKPGMRPVSWAFP